MAEVVISGLFFFGSFAFGELAEVKNHILTLPFLLLGSFGGAKEPTEGSSAKPNEQ